MLSASTKMELRVQFAVRMCEVLGEDCWKDTTGDRHWLEIMRNFMEGKLIQVKRFDCGNGEFRFEMEFK